MKLHSLVQNSARKMPGAVAIRHAQKSMTYAELDAWSNRIARHLAKIGVETQDRVGIWMEKSPFTIAVMQAVLRLGAAYVPIDPSSPVARARSILTDCKVKALVTTKSRVGSVLNGDLASLANLLLEDIEPLLVNLQADDLPAPIISDDALAYILYTSGSTGVPKGICLSHKNAISFVDWVVETLQPKVSDRFANHAPFHFDLSVLDLYAAFASGASVSLIPEGLAYAPQRLVDFIRSEGITIWYSVPSALILMMERAGMLNADLNSLKVILFAGEPFPLKYLRLLRESFPQSRLLNLYGPTETNVCTFYEVNNISPDRTLPVPIGKASCGDTVWAVKPDGSKTTEIGDEGELIVSGPTVMLGYWGKPSIQNSQYSTGDIVRLVGDGDFEFIGRKDHQVKLKGYRVDLGEIEAVLSAYHKISEVAVVVMGAGLESRVFACVLPKGDASLDLIEVKRVCAEKLPVYMIVDGLRIFSEFPRTSTGKTDRKQLTALIMEERIKNAA